MCETEVTSETFVLAAASTGGAARQQKLRYQKDTWRPLWTTRLFVQPNNEGGRAKRTPIRVHHVRRPVRHTELFVTRRHWTFCLRGIERNHYTQLSKCGPCLNLLFASFGIFFCSDPKR